MKKKIFLPLAFTLLPLVASAQFGGVRSYITAIGGFVETLTVIVAGLALLVFFWGLVKFIMNAGDEEAVKEGKRLMIWGIVALFVMVSVWGIVRWIGLELNIGTGAAPKVPTFQRGTP